MLGAYCGVPGTDDAGVANADDGIEREGGGATEGADMDADAEGKAGGGVAAGGATLGGGAGGGFRSKLWAWMMSLKSGLSLIIFIIWFSMSCSEIAYKLLSLDWSSRISYKA